MLINLFQTVRSAGVPCSLRELLDLLGALEKQMVYANIDDFYYLSRAILVKDEKHYDKFDKAFDIYFKGIEKLEDVFQALIPEDWLRKAFEKELDPDELKKIKSLGGLDKLLEEFKKRLEEQKERHEGGNKWIGTNGTSPFGHGGQNPEGIRVGGQGGQKSAVKVWEQRQFSNLDDSIIIGTREMQMALRRLRRFARHGNDLELDMNDTIKSTAKNAGYLDIKMVPERSNAVKVIVLFDVGGSMDPYIKLCEELFSAIKTEFKHLEYFYFHNCIYESVWKDNRRRSQERFLIQDIINKYSADYKIIVVGDATMAPYEITNAGGSIEHWNEEPGSTWIKRISNHFDNMAWLNPVPDDHWDYSSSVCILRDLFDNRMYPLTLKGLEEAMGGAYKMNTSNSQGIKWGPFTLRIPFIHIKFRAGEFFQGMVISGATAFAAVPVAMGLGLTFEEGVALSFIAGTLIASGPIFFGEPMAPGWITPALPIVIAAFAAKGQFTGVYDVTTFQYMAAICIEFTLLVFILGVTGWGKKLIQIIPNGLKAGIILGAALAAFYQVFVTDLDKLMIQPISMFVAITVCIITTFSDPFKRLASKNSIINKIGSLGLLPGFILAAFIAFLFNEVTFNIEWGFKVPDVVSLFNRTSPLSIGFPTFDMYLEAIPLVIIGYTLLFGDLITANEVLLDAQKSRPDEKLDINLNRSHLSIAARNFIGLILNPFFPTQGALWTGVHVVVVERWKKGFKEMPSIFDGLGSYYLMALPILYFTLPFITLMKPLMQMALTLTLILTGFACAYVAMAIPKKNSEMASALLIAVFITFFSAWIGLLVGIILSILVIGIDKTKN